MDLIASVVSSIQSATKKKLKFFSVKKSKYVTRVLRLLERESMISGFVVGRRTIRVYLNMKISNLYFERVSKQGNRVYVSPSLISPVNQGSGLYILSSTKGIITDSIAKSLNLGGEVLFKVYWK